MRVDGFILYTLGRFQLFFGKVDYSPQYVVTRPVETDILAKTLVIVGHKDLPKWAFMRCPCGCEEVLTLSLMKKVSPHWNLYTDKWSRVTLSPSVWKNDGCRSHFFIKGGKIIWC